MNCTSPRRPSQAELHADAFSRRTRAAWIDYLETTRGTHKHSYEEIERVAWERLQRRLRRNEERHLQAVGVR